MSQLPENARRAAAHRMYTKSARGTSSVNSLYTGILMFSAPLRLCLGLSNPAVMHGCMVVAA